MKRDKWYIIFALSLIVASALIYSAHFLIFRKVDYILNYFFVDLAFLPLEVLIVTMILHRLLDEQEKQDSIKKLNMFIGIFFSDAGTDLIRKLSHFNSCTGIDYLAKLKNIESAEDFLEARQFIKTEDIRLDSRLKNMVALRDFLESKREFIIHLLENPKMMEHESFSELLWAVLHLNDELSCRTELTGLPEADMDHISEDMKRANLLLVQQWMTYMKHLMDDYPYMFTFALRTNPFNKDASAIINTKR